MSYLNFTSRGRASRSEYLITIIIVSLAGLSTGDISEYASENIIVALLLFAISIFLIWVGFAVGARRCHDLGHNGFWQLIPFYVIWMAFVKGTDGENEYGPDPSRELE